MSEVKSEVKILTTEEVIESAKAELIAVCPEQATNAIIAKNAALSIAGTEDKEGEKAVDTARKEMKALRIAIEKKRKELKDIALKYGREVDGTAKLLSDPVEKEENRLQAMLDDVERLRKEAAEDERRRVLQRFEDRTKFLFSIGFGFNGVVYELGRIKATPERINTATDEEWVVMESKAKAEAERVAAEAAALEAERAAAEAERRRQEEEIARLRAELEAKKAAEQPPVQPQPQPAVRPKAAAEQPDMDFSNIPPVFTRPQPTPTPVQPIPEAPQPIVPLSRTEEMLREIIGVNETVSTPHFRGGYRKGVSIMKMLIVQLLDDPTIKNRAELKERINLL
jgi:hypothetical protein